jgi:hypothetical protein
VIESLRVPFPLLTRVAIDDGDVGGRILGYHWSGYGVEAEVAWFANGEMKSARVSVERLKAS